MRMIHSVVIHKKPSSKRPLTRSKLATWLPIVPILINFRGGHQKCHYKVCFVNNRLVSVFFAELEVDRSSME